MLGKTMEEKRKDERRFAALPPQSVTNIADNMGLPELPADVPRLLAEDATYRIRALLQDACHLMKHARRKRLTADDMNKALKQQDVPPVYGHGAPECTSWRQVRDPVTKETDLTFLEDAEISLGNVACGNQVPSHIGATSVRANWLVVEGNQKAAGFTQSAGKPARLLSEELLSYYDNITSSLTGSDLELVKIALSDLRTNLHLAPVVPHFVHFVSSEMRKSRDCEAQMRLLYLLQALLDNKSLFLRTPPIVECMCESAMHCLLQDNNHKQHWLLRDIAARVIAAVCRLWGSGGLAEKQERLLSQELSDSTRSLSAHYGVVMAIAHMGPQCVEQNLLPRLMSFWHHVTGHETTSMTQRVDACQVKGALMFACEVYLNHKASMHEIERKSSVRTTAVGAATSPSKRLGDSTIQHSNVKGESQDNGTSVDPNQTNLSKHSTIASLYQTMIDCFGDSLLDRIKLPNDMLELQSHDRKLTKAEVTVSLADADSHRTGEEMLQEFLHVKPERLKQETDVSKSTVKAARDKSQLAFQITSRDLGIRTANLDATSGSRVSQFGKRPRADESLGHRQKRQRRSGSKTRLSDVFEIQLRRRSQSGITFNILGRSQEVLKSVGRPAKKTKGLGVAGRGRHTSGSSDFRNICSKIKPFGKMKAKSKATVSCHNAGFPL